MAAANEPNPNKALWEKGDFTRLAAFMRDSGEDLVASLGITPGLDVLDLGCGDGTTAVPEAQLGANVLGVDIASNLVAAGNERAQSSWADEPPVPGGRCLRPERARRRQLRPRRQHLRRDVRAEARGRGEGGRSRDPAGRPDRDGQLDSGRSDAGRADPQDQLGLLAAAARGIRQPDDLGRRGGRDRAVHRRGRARGADLVRARHLRVQFPGTPSDYLAEFRDTTGRR